MSDVAPRMPRGKFITIEGIEGVGKSSNLEFVANHLRDAGQTVITTREPGGTPVAERIRKIALDSEPGTISASCELLLMFAARASHVGSLIEPALARGDWVVCDRFVDATYAYQGGGRGMPTETIAQLERLVLGELAPDLTLLLDAPLEIANRRRSDRGTSDRFEVEDQQFFERVRDRYRVIAELDPERVKLVDASADLASVTSHIARILAEFINKVY